MKFIILNINVAFDRHFYYYSQKLKFYKMAIKYFFSLIIDPLVLSVIELENYHEKVWMSCLADSLNLKIQEKNDCSIDLLIYY